ncbi:MAG: transcriptional repressor AgaR [Ignavibacteriaceae bacterium]
MSENNSKIVSVIERRNKIIDKLETDKQVFVNQLSKEFDVSEVTIRNDLAYLEEKGILHRTHGGGIRQRKVALEYGLTEKEKQNLPQKQRIGLMAAELIQENDTIILDSGSTTMEIAKNLSNFKNLTVITNALNIIGQIKEYPDVHLIVPGGVLKPQSLALYGAPAEDAFKNYYCDKFFMGVDAIDLNHGLTTPTIEEAHLNRVMIQISKEVILVADSSKFNKRNFVFIAHVNILHTIITDSGLSQETKASFENLGIKVIIV